MPNRLGRIVRLATLPETRRLIAATATSPSVRLLVNRAVHDRSGLRQDLRRANPRQLVRTAVRHPVATELASVGLALLPARYGPLGWVAGWAARRALNRSRPPVE